MVIRRLLALFIAVWGFAMTLWVIDWLVPLDIHASFKVGIFLTYYFGFAGVALSLAMYEKGK